MIARSVEFGPLAVWDMASGIGLYGSIERLTQEDIPRIGHNTYFGGLPRTFYIAQCL